MKEIVDEERLGDLWFQQDGATEPGLFEGWSARLPDLNICDFYKPRF